MCDYRSIYYAGGSGEEKECPHNVFEETGNDGKIYCVFHNNNGEKDVERFYGEFKKLYLDQASERHRFPGFVFPVQFDFQRLREDTGNLKFIGAIFANAVFFCTANLAGAEFTGTGTTSFLGARFLGEGVTSFIGARFRGEAGTSFDRVRFDSKGGTSFHYARLEGKGAVSFRGETFTNQSDVDFRNVVISHPEKVTFDAVNLNRVRFRRTELKDIRFNEIWWTNREYGKNRPKKRNMVFDETFQTGTIYQILRWLMIARAEKEEGKKTSKWLKRLRMVRNGIEEYHYDVYRLYNDLRLNYERTGRYHEAGDFFIGAMEMRRCGNSEKPLIRVLLHCYRLFSLYGERPVRAFWWLAGLWLVFGFIYGWMGIGYQTQEPTSYIKDLLNGLIVSLDVLALGKIQPFYDVIKGPIIPIIRAIETIFGALFLSLFILAMNRKFRRTKD